MINAANKDLLTLYKNNIAAAKAAGGDLQLILRLFVTPIDIGITDSGSLDFSFKNLRVALMKENIFNKDTINMNLKQVENTINSFYITTPGKNRFNRNTIKTGTSFNTTGEEIVADTMSISDYIPVTSGKTIYIGRKANSSTTTLTSINTNRVLYFDSNKNRILPVRTTTSSTIDIPTGCAFIRIAITTLYVTNFGVQLEYDAMTTWEEYTTITSLNSNNITTLRSDVDALMTP